MSRKEISFSIVLFLSIFGCQGQKDLEIEIDLRYKNYISDNFQQYEFMYSQISDTLQNWIDKRLDIGKAISFHEFEIDSLIIFNADSSQLCSTLNMKVAHDDGVQDYIQVFNGRKINGKWYFYQGGTHVFPHDNHHDSTYANYTFDELGYLSYKNILRGFLKFNEDGTYYINQRGFERYRTPFGPKSDLTELQRDSIYLAYVNRKNKKTISPKEYKDIEESIRNSVRPPEPPRDPKDKKVRTFESDAWKNRYQKQD